MKKQIFGGIAIVAIAVAVALNVNMTNKKSDNTSLLALANVEALADPEFTRIGDDDSNPYFEEMVITPVYNTNGSLHVTVKNITIEVGSFQNGLIGYLSECNWAFWGRCDHSKIGFTRV